MKKLFVTLFLVVSLVWAQRVPIVIESIDTYLDETCDSFDTHLYIVRTTGEILYCDGSNWVLMPVTTDLADVKVLNKVYYANLHATAGSGTSGSKWTGWESVVAANRRVHFPTGHYETAGVTVTNLEGVVLTGDGSYDSIIHCTAAGGDCLKVDLSSLTRPANDGYFSAQGIRFIQGTTMTTGSVVNLEWTQKFHLSDIWIDTQDTDSALGIALSVVDTNGGVIDGLQIWADDSSGNNFLVGLDIGNGVTDNRGNVSLFGGEIRDCLNGIRVAEGASNTVNNIHLFGTKLKRAAGAAGAGIGVDFNAQTFNAVLKGAHIESYATPIKIDNATNITIEGCMISRFDETAAATNSGISIVNGSHGVRIAHNRFTNNSDGGYGINRDATGTDERMVIVGNSWNNVNTVFNDAATPSAGLWITNNAAGEGHWVRHTLSTIGRNLGEDITLKFNDDDEDQSLFWDDSDERFELSDDIDVAGRIISIDAQPRVFLRENDNADQDYQLDVNSGSFRISELNDAFVNQSTPFVIEAGTADDTLVLDSADRVGVGTNAPASKLEVAGDVVIQPGAASAYSIHADADDLFLDSSSANLGISLSGPIQTVGFHDEGETATNLGALMRFVKTSSKLQFYTGTGGSYEFYVANESPLDSPPGTAAYILTGTSFGLSQGVAINAVSGGTYNDTISIDEAITTTGAEALIIFDRTANADSFKIEWDGDMFWADNTGTFDTKLSRPSADTLQTDDDFVVDGAFMLDTAVASFGDADATPSVAQGGVYQTANTGATTITDFDGGIVGQQIVVIVNDGNTDFDCTASGIKCSSPDGAGSDWTTAADGDFMVCWYDGTDWYCSCGDTT